MGQNTFPQLVDIPGAQCQQDIAGLQQLRHLGHCTVHVFDTKYLFVTVGGDSPTQRQAVDPLDDRLLTLDAALSQLLVEHPAIGELVKLRYFGGLTTEQAARALKVSSRTAKRHWAFAKAWLRREIDRDGLEDRPT